MIQSCWVRLLNGSANLENLPFYPSNKKNFEMKIKYSKSTIVKLTFIYYFCVLLNAGYSIFTVTNIYILINWTNKSLAVGKVKAMADLHQRRAEMTNYSYPFIALSG